MKANLRKTKFLNLQTSSKETHLIYYNNESWFLSEEDLCKRVEV